MFRCCDCLVFEYLRVVYVVDLVHILVFFYSVPQVRDQMAAQEYLEYFSFASLACLPIATTQLIDFSQLGCN